MKRKPFIAANWKMNKLVEDSVEYGETLVEKLKDENVDLKKIDVAVCVPYIHMAALKVIFVLRNISVGAQNMHYEESGAYTGEISPAMLEDMGIECVIIGHSERRTYFGETDEACAKKVAAAHAHGIRPILCVGESLEQREAGAHFNTVKAQLSGSLAGISGEQAAATVIAYEPVWAIGTGKTATAQDANATIGVIRRAIAGAFSDAVADAVRIQYGGSMNPKNAAELMAMPEIDGGLIGGASLKAEDFAKVVNY